MKTMNCPRCGQELDQDSIYVLGFCEPCAKAIIEEWKERQSEPIPYEVPTSDAAVL